MAQQAKANTARADAEAARPGEGQLYAVPHLALPQISHLPLYVLAAPLGEAAAADGQGALNALDVDGNRCGFDHACSRPVRIMKGAKKTA